MLILEVIHLVLVGKHFGEDYSTIQAIASSSSIGALSEKTANMEIKVQNKVGFQGMRLLRVDINIGAVDDLYGCQFDLNFDPKVLKVVGTQAGDILSFDGASTYWSVSEVDNRVGRIDNAICVRKATKEGISDSGTLATVIFELKNVSISDTTKLNLGNIKLVDADTHKIGVSTKNALLNWEELLIPERPRLLQNYPNPFNPETWIPFELAQDADVVIRIFNLQGQLIRTLDIGHKEAGLYLNKDRAVYWNGCNDTGEKVGSGTYFYQIDTGDFIATKKLVILK